MNFIRTEPDSGSQTCGYQIQVSQRQNDGHSEIRMAPGNAIGR
ncbi:hypothetical protein [Streptomyces sp. NPDC088258]